MNDVTVVCYLAFLFILLVVSLFKTQRYQNQLVQERERYKFLRVRYELLQEHYKAAQEKLEDAQKRAREVTLTLDMLPEQTYGNIG